MKLSPIEDGFGVVAGELTLRGDGLPATVRQIEQALDAHLLVVIPGTGFSQEEYIAFGQCFGRLEDFDFAHDRGPNRSLPLSNLGANGRIQAPDSPYWQKVAADALWHTDNTYRPDRARYSMLLAEIAPKAGGETQFCDTRAAYDALPQDRKAELDHLVAIHSLIYSRSLTGYTDWSEDQRRKLRPIPQPLVFRNPNTGRKSLYLASHIAEIVGWPTEQARKLAAELIDFAAQRVVYSHKWRAGDVVIWDDRATMHRRAPYDQTSQARKLYTMRVIEPSPLFNPEIDYATH